MKHQEGKIYFAISGGGNRCTIPVVNRHCYGLWMLCTIALQRNHPDTGAQLVLDMTKQLCSSSSRASQAYRAASA